MKLPKSCTIAGITWTIAVEPISSDDAGDFGQTDWKSRTITLYTLPHEGYKQPLKSTLFHELLHAALSSTGTDNICGSDSKEEAIVTALENALWPLIESGLLS